MKLLKFNSRHRSTISHDEARLLTALFLDGATTDADERRLYAYYRSSSVDPELEPYREMFAWYDSLAEPAGHDRHSYRRHGLIAASVTAALLVGVGLFTIPSTDADAANIYAGSFIIRDGKKITDLSVILPELRNADRIVDSTMNAIESHNPENIEREVLASALSSVADPQVKEMLLAELTF